MGRYLGQHFLTDLSILHATRDAIQEMIERHQTQRLIEIGPGQGALTQYIHDLSQQFVCIEKDTTMRPHLLRLVDEQQIIWGDVLEESYTDDIDEPYIVVGNLPYYITSPIFRKFFEQETSAVGGVFLIQKEVADKIASDSTRKSYLWWLLNYRYDIAYLYTVDAGCFDPPPRVQSAVVRFTRRQSAASVEWSAMISFLDHVSSMKRKTLGAIAKKLAKKDVHLTIPTAYQSLRLEQLDRDMMATIIALQDTRSIV